MNIGTLLEQFIEVEGHVAAGEQHLSGQRRRIRALEREGHQTLAHHARALLEQMEQSQQMHIVHRDRLRAGLDDEAGEPSPDEPIQPRGPG
jgi:hypothetical protein